MLRKIFAVAGTSAVLVLGAPVAHAAGGDPAACENFARPIIISQGYDPLHLDTDGDGIACEHNPGEPVKTDLYADLRGTDGPTSPAPTVTVTKTESPREQLPATGATDVFHRHPVRSIALGALIVVFGGALVFAVRRKR
jgi:hypothetical protein